MKYLVIETINGELFNDVWLFENINQAENFIESCAWATDKNQWLNDPVIQIVSDFYNMNDFDIKKSEKRFRKDFCI